MQVEDSGSGVEGASLSRERGKGVGRSWEPGCLQMEAALDSLACG